MDLVSRHPVIEDVLDTLLSGKPRSASGGHAYRVFNFARRIVGHVGEDDALAIASAFHDIGIWTDHTFSRAS